MWKRGDSWKQLLWEWPFPELNVDCSKSKCNVFVDWQPKHAVANSQWPVLLRSLKGCCMMIILIWFPSQEISEDNIFLLSSTIIVVIGTFGVVVLCVFCVFLLAGFSSWCVPPNSFCLIRCEQKRWRIGEPSMRWVFLWKGLKCLSDTKFQIH